jgi:hypothetical protein
MKLTRLLLALLFLALCVGCGSSRRGGGGGSDDDDSAGDDDDAANDDDVADDDDAANDDDGADDDDTGIGCEAGEYQLNLSEAFGSWPEAWDGDSVSAYDGSGNLLGTFTNSTGGTQSFFVATPDCISTSYASDGTYGEGNSYEVIDPTGDTVFTDVAPFSSTGYSDCQEDCFDGIDNDVDGDTDCVDLDCFNECSPSSLADAGAVCTSWDSAWADMSEGTWSGNIATCDPGDISADGRANALAQVNLYRWMTGLPTVVNDPTLDGYAQECALMMDANDAIDHYPPTSWDCYTVDGATGATSNLYGIPGVAAVYGYIIDYGANNWDALGHRRHIFSNDMGLIGLGSTGDGGYSCLYPHDHSGGPGNAWTAWPPPGPVPEEAFQPIWASGSTGINQTGWSVQSLGIDLSGAQVTVTAGGVNMPVTTRQLDDNAGGWGVQAIAFVPDGWTTQAGTTYTVEVTGITLTIEYEVEVVDCTQPVP